MILPITNGPVVRSVRAKMPPVEGHGRKPLVNDTPGHQWPSNAPNTCTMKRDIRIGDCRADQDEWNQEKIFGNTIFCRSTKF
jgi:hypothetical protein